MVYTVQDCYCGKDYHPTLSCCWVSTGPAVTTTGPVCVNVMVLAFTCLPVSRPVIKNIISSSVSTLSRSGFAVDLEPVLGALGVRRGYTLDEMPVYDGDSHAFTI